MSAINNKYLDSTGLGHLWGKIKNADKAVFGEVGLDLKYSKEHPDHKGTPWMWLEANTEVKDPDGQKVIVPKFSSPGFDASEFIVNGVLEDVIIDTGINLLAKYREILTHEQIQQIEGKSEKFLLFIWNTDDGSGKKVIIVELSALASTYTAGSGIDISDGNQISAKLDGVTKGKNYLTSGDNGLSVRDMGADVTKTIGAIPIAGGALADDINEENLPSDWKTEKGTYAIPAGKNIEQILKDLLCKEKWGAVKLNEASAPVVSVEAPTVSHSGSGVQEYNASVTWTANNGTSSISCPTASFTGMTYGYSAANDQSRDSKNTSLSNTAKSALKTAETTLTVTGVITGTDATGTEAASSATVSKSAALKLGDNRVAATATSSTYSVTYTTFGPVYACSNLGATKEEVGFYHEAHTTKAIAETQSKTSEEGSSTVVGVLPVYNNNGSGSTKEQPDTKMTLFNGTTVEVSFNKEADGHRMKFAFPAGRTLSKIELYNPNSGKWDNVVVDPALIKDTSSKNINGKTVDYLVWLREDSTKPDGQVGASKYRFTLSVSTNNKGTMKDADGNLSK